ncbi:hypothetical protein [Streptomyces radicis]|uniref:Uncharacterized protein n=1 Tax=Streptomyces radicis TaxID=1750517 RepID=A0A3A9WDQ1_9ACTN|nr:hypothetical protein [Streptomyces radicis]RKN11461.1 hypothetical protein D7319_05845 [Streptomyces radicis]RKN26520.1 hypothetical protein D7318_03815 [Streptomyces radicis]
MTYIVTLTPDQVADNEGDWLVSERFTKALPTGLDTSDTGTRLAFLVGDYRARSGAIGRNGLAEHGRFITWMGLVQRINTVGPVDRSITIEPMRRCPKPVPLDGPDGILASLPSIHRAHVEQALSGSAGHCGTTTWHALREALLRRHPELARYIDWLLAHLNALVFNVEDAADCAWQEQKDAAQSLTRVTDFPHSALSAWGRPASRDEPYLAGLIPDPVENSLIDHDVRVGLGGEAPLFDDWRQRSDVRCDIHVLEDSAGRRLEVVNVNATPVESRLGTDMIYYHHPTHSFVLVQYKRLEFPYKEYRVNKELLDQMDRLEQVSRLSSKPASSHEWRLSPDACFLKFAHWRNGAASSTELAHGLYIPLSYARVLLEDDCTLGPRGGRIFSYERAVSYLVGAEFAELVKLGRVGTVGTSVEQLRDFGLQRAREGYSVMLGFETSDETPRERAVRVRSRSAKKRPKVNSYSPPTSQQQ